MSLGGDSFEDIIRRVRRADYNARLASMVTLEGDMKTRIHQKGLKSDGSAIGTYSSRWKKVRDDEGNQTNYVDLEFKSDLRASLQTGESEGMPVLGFDDDDQYTKAVGLSNGNSRWKGFGDIYTPTSDELDNLIDAYSEQLQIEFDALRSR